jgi:hypothetical protein
MSVGCLVRDLSEAGARLELEGDVSIPDQFDLSIPKRNLTRKSAIRWKSGKELGVVFLGSGGALPTTQEIAERVARLEADVVEIRRLVKQLAAALAAPPKRRG